MANKNTKRLRKNAARNRGMKTGRCLDTGDLRAKSGKKPASLPAKR